MWTVDTSDERDEIRIVRGDGAGAHAHVERAALLTSSSRCRLRLLSSQGLRRGVLKRVAHARLQLLQRLHLRLRLRCRHEVMETQL